MRKKGIVAGAVLILACMMFGGGKSYAAEAEMANEAAKTTNDINDNVIETVPSEQRVSTAKPKIFLNGSSLSYQYVDSTYADSRLNSIGIIEEKTRQLKENSKKYLLDSNENGWTIGGQFWSETSSKKHKIEYANTTGFSMNLPDGDYKVTVNFRNAEKNAYKIATWDERGIQTNIETVPAKGSLKQEFEASVIDGNLKLFFIPQTTATYPEGGWKQICIQSVSLQTMPKRQRGSIPTLYIVGDSTAHSRTKNVYPREGWGQELYRCFEFGKLKYSKRLTAGNGMTPYTEYGLSTLTIQNWAYSGESTKSFWKKGRFDNLLNCVRPGDYVMIQLGHNDAAKNKLGYYTTPSAYRKNLITFVKACQTRGAVCIFLSPTPRCVFEGNKIKSAVPEYKSAMKSAAKQTNSVFVDVGKAVEDFMTTVGKKTALSYYMVLNAGQYTRYPIGYDDNSHYNYTGARKASEIIAVTLKETSAVPARLRKQITISNDYYQGVTVDIEKVTVKKTKVTSRKKKSSGKIKKVQYKLAWAKQKNAQQYVIYQYAASTKTYKEIATTRKNSYTLSKKLTKKQLAKIRVRAVLSRF